MSSSRRAWSTRWGVGLVFAFFFWLVSACSALYRSSRFFILFSRSVRLHRFSHASFLARLASPRLPRFLLACLVLLRCIFLSRSLLEWCSLFLVTFYCSFASLSRLGCRREILKIKRNRSRCCWPPWTGSWHSWRWTTKRRLTT